MRLHIYIQIYRDMYAYVHTYIQGFAHLSVYIYVHYIYGIIYLKLIFRILWRARFNRSLDLSTLPRERPRLHHQCLPAAAPKLYRAPWMQVQR